MSLLNWILSSSSAWADPVDRRARPRKRTRLRPGKVLREDRTFLADCAILDRSQDGMRIRIFGDVGSLDEAALVLDENEGVANAARLAWCRPPEAGLRVEARSEPLCDDDRRRLSGPYYAVTD